MESDRDTTDSRRGRRWPRRMLSVRTNLLMWGLRLYVVGMLAVVAVQVARLA